MSYYTICYSTPWPYIYIVMSACWQSGYIHHAKKLLQELTGKLDEFYFWSEIFAEKLDFKGSGNCCYTFSGFNSGMVDTNVKKSSYKNSESVVEFFLCILISFRWSAVIPMRVIYYTFTFPSSVWNLCWHLILDEIFQSVFLLPFSWVVM